MRVIIDTNVWVSGLLWRGMARTVVQLAAQGRIALFMSPPMLQELTEVLAYPRFRQRLDQLGLTETDLIVYALGLVTMVDHPTTQVRIVPEDPDDDMFLHCATSIGARAIVSGDSHLLSLRCHEGIPVMTVREFVDRFSDPDGPPESTTE